MTCEILKGIGIDSAKSEKYPWKDLDVGDGFLVKGSVQHQQSVQRQAPSRGISYNMKFKTKKTDEGMLIVRIA